MVFISGQKAWRAGMGDAVAGSIEEQTARAIDNIESILKGVGMGLPDLVRLQCFLSDISDYERFNKAYRERLGDCKPTRCVMGNIQLRSNALVELVAEAYRSACP